MSDHWSLFIDESGNLADPHDFSVLGGFLIKQSHQQSIHYKSRLRAMTPGVPWPIHRSYVRIPLMHAVWTGLGLYPIQDPALVDVSKCVHEVLSEHCPDLYQSLNLSAERSSRNEPDYKVVRRLDQKLLMLRPNLHLALEAHTNNVMRRIGLILEDALDEGCFVLSTESFIGEGAHLAMSLNTNRYVVMLASLIKRAVDLLLLRGESGRLMVHPCSLRVINHSLGMPIPLRGEDLVTAIEMMTGSGHREDGAKDAVIRILPGTVEQFDADAVAELVFADHLANTARTLLSGRPRNLQRVNGLFRRALSGDVVTTGELSHLSSTGQPQALIDAARERVPSEDDIESVSDAVWTGQQAIAWAYAISRW